MWLCVVYGGDGGIISLGDGEPVFECWLESEVGAVLKYTWVVVSFVEYGDRTVPVVRFQCRVVAVACFREGSSRLLTMVLFI